MGFVLVTAASFVGVTASISLVYTLKFALLTGLAGFMAFKALHRRLIFPAAARLMLASAAGWSVTTIPAVFRAEAPVAALALWASYLFLAVFAVAIVPNDIRGDEAQKRWEVLWLFASLLALAGSALIGFTQEGRGFVVYGDTGRVRYSAGFINPNYVGLFCLLGILVALRLLVLGKKEYVVLLPLLFAGAWLSGSRGALATGAIVFILFAGLNWRSPFRKVAKLPWRPVLLLQAVAAAAVVVLVFSTTVTAEQLNSALSNRLANWGSAIGALNGTEWLIGIGFGGDQPRFRPGSLSVDNYYLNQLIQTGVFGLLGLLAFMTATLFAVLQIRDRKTAHYLLSVLAAWSLYSFFESTLFSIGSAASVYVWAEVGLGLKRRM